MILTPCPYDPMRNNDEQATERLFPGTTFPGTSKLDPTMLPHAITVACAAAKGRKQRVLLVVNLLDHLADRSASPSQMTRLGSCALCFVWG